MHSLVFHFFVGLLVVSYYKSIVTDPGTVPRDIVFILKKFQNFDYVCHHQNDNFTNVEEIKEKARKQMIYRLLNNKDIDKPKVLKNLGLPSDFDIKELGPINTE